MNTVGTTTTTTTAALDVRKGASAAAAVLAVPGIPLAFLAVVDAVSSLRVDAAVETSARAWAFEADRGGIMLLIGWPLWTVLATVVFVSQSGLLRALADRAGRGRGAPRNDGPFRHFRPVDRARLTFFVERVDSGLLLRLPGRRRREIRQELESNLAEAAAQHGAAHALAKLGSARSLVRGYLDEHPRRLDVGLGAAFAAAVWGLLVIVALLMSVAFIEGSQAAGATEAVRQSFGYFSVEASTARFGVEMNLLVVLVAGLIAFTCGSKPWRLLGRSGGG